jgi:group II intron reverse transcriptase/maturase
VVLSVLRERGRLSLPCEQLYRQMFNKELYLLAYGNIYSNTGAMTPGASAETADGMSEEKIDQIIELMRQEKYRFSPARRIYVPKKNGKLRPLGLPSWSGKIVGEVVRLILEAYYEPRFSDRSHGFRKKRGCHTALGEIQRTWTGTVWFIEGDISDCYGSMDHQILLTILAEKIHDQRFLRLIAHMLKAGYLEDWEYQDTLSGCPQGGVASPILSNIYLDKLDKFVEQELIPQYTRGLSRIPNPAYRETYNRLRQAQKRGDRATARSLVKQRRSLPKGDPADPGYRRLRYCRYADLCRGRHKPASADLWIMPASGGFSLVKSGRSAYRVGITLRVRRRPGFLVRVSDSSGQEDDHGDEHSSRRRSAGRGQHGPAGGFWQVAEQGTGPVAGIGAVLFQAVEGVPGLDRRGRGGQRPGRGQGDRFHGGVDGGPEHVDGEGNGDVAAGVPAVRARDRPDGRPAGGSGSLGRVVADVLAAPRHKGRGD